MVQTCDNCGSSVSSAFARVFKYDDDLLAGCPSCSTGTWLHKQTPEIVEHIREYRDRGEYPHFRLGYEGIEQIRQEVKDNG